MTESSTKTTTLSSDGLDNDDECDVTESSTHGLDERGMTEVSMYGLDESPTYGLTESSTNATDP